MCFLALTALWQGKVLKYRPSSQSEMCVLTLPAFATLVLLYLGMTNATSAHLTNDKYLGDDPEGANSP